MDVGQVCRFGTPRVDDDQCPRRIVGNLLEDLPSLGEAVRLPRVLAPENSDLGAFVVARGVTTRAAEQLTIDPELARLLLRQGVGGVPDAQRGARRAAVAATEMIALPSAAIEQDLVATVFGDHVVELGSNLSDGGIPIDHFEGSVRSTAQWTGQPMRTVLVMIDAQSLLARVPLRTRVGLVAAHPGDRRAIDAHFEPTVDGAQHAGCGMPGLVAGLGTGLGTGFGVVVHLGLRCQFNKRTWSAEWTGASVRL